MEEDISLRKNTNVGVIMRPLGAEVNSLGASHVRQMVPAEGAGCDHKGVPSTGGLLGPGLQTLVNAVEALLDDDKKDKLIRFLTLHWDIFSTEGEPPGCTKLVQHNITMENSLPIK